ncbi:hypothetical protein VMCG_06059 [Cytospora schulzeri]|uniref:BTB domain-containing protein n=1 Tax=Cytospora schulzeri TaxID=448051 RepID=A0A423WGC8_9PEZI|nr:hypothetical protein VMCG_06059 [Valsa malicola]
MSAPTTSGSSATSLSTSISHENDDNNIVQLPPVNNVGLEVFKRPTQADLGLLETGVFSDFTVVCGAKEWKTHRAILNRCPYFEAAMSERNGFKECQEHKIILEGFEEYEISWLLQYIYSGELIIDEDETPSKSFFEGCVLLWGIGDYFRLEGLCQEVLNQLSQRCMKYSIITTRVRSVANGISFLPDLEAGIRAAWGQDRAAGPVQARLINLCFVLTPYIRDLESFIALLAEIPDFSNRFLKAILGCRGDTLFYQADGSGHICWACRTHIPKIDLQNLQTDVFYIPDPLLASFRSNSQILCSRECYNRVMDIEWQHLD